MHGELDGLLEQLEAVKADGRALVVRLSHAQLNWRPVPERWAAAECLDHLNVSVGRTLPALDAAIAAGRARGRVASGPFRYGWLARMIVRSMEPPPRVRFTRPRAFAAPRGEHRAEALPPEFLRVRVTSPAYRLFRLPLGAYFSFLVAHERRHLWQARRLPEEPRFPSA